MATKMQPLYTQKTEKRLVLCRLWLIASVVVLGFASCNPYDDLYPARSTTAIPTQMAATLSVIPSKVGTAVSDTCTVATGIDRGALNLRTGPGTNYPVIRVLTEGEVLQVVEDGAWFAVIDAQGREGFINSRFCR